MLNRRRYARGRRRRIIIAVRLVLEERKDDVGRLSSRRSVVRDQPGGTPCWRFVCRKNGKWLIAAFKWGVIADPRLQGICIVHFDLLRGRRYLQCYRMKQMVWRVRRRAESEKAFAYITPDIMSRKEKRWTGAGAQVSRERRGSVEVCI